MKQERTAYRNLIARSLIHIMLLSSKLSQTISREMSVLGFRFATF